VKTRGSSVLRLATPVRAWAQRFALALMISAAFGLMLMSKNQSAGVERLRVLVADAAAPILELMTKPVETVTGVFMWFGNVATLYSENGRLREENARLLQWHDVAKRLEIENAALRDLLSLPDEPAAKAIVARVIGDNGGAFVRTLLVDAGAREGVAKNQAALTGEGVAGRVVEVGERAARVLLITDINSRIPVLLEGSRNRAVLAGDNGPMPMLVHLPLDGRPKIGDRVVTSGFGGIFPPGIPVGTVARIDGDEVRVVPLVQWQRIEFLRLVDYRTAALAGLGPASDGIAEGVE
jgi:rod shape-determining protein MreC